MKRASRDGAAALDDARAFIGRFCALPVEHAYTAMTLWAAHAWALDAFDSTPRLAFLSPEPGSGKTRALEILTLLVPPADARGQRDPGRPVPLRRRPRRPPHHPVR